MSGVSDISPKISALKRRVAAGDYRYLVKRLLPGGNWILYWGRQVVFRLSDFDQFEKMYGLVSQKCDHEFRLANANDIESLKTISPKKRNLFDKRLANGQSCYVTVKNGEISGYLWAFEPTGPQFMTNSMWWFKPETMDGIWCNDGYVRPEYRLIGLFVYLMGGVRKEFLKKGYLTQYGETNQGNKMSLNTHLRVGYKIVKEVFFISLFGLKMYIVKDPESGARAVNFRYLLGVNNNRL